MRRDKNYFRFSFSALFRIFQFAQKKNAIAGKETRENSQIKGVYRSYNARKSNDGHARDFLSRGARNKFLLTAQSVVNLRPRLILEYIFNDIKITYTHLHSQSWFKIFIKI